MGGKELDVVGKKTDVSLETVIHFYEVDEGFSD